MSARFQNIAMWVVGLILLTILFAYSLGQDARFLPSPKWVDLAQLPAAIVGAFLGVYFAFLITRRLRAKAAGENREFGQFKFVLLVIGVVAISGYATRGVVITSGAKMLTGGLREAQTISTQIDRLYSTSRGSDGWLLVYGHRLPMPMAQIRNCVSRGSIIEFTGRGSDFGMFIDEIIVIDRTHGDTVVVSYTDGTADIPERCA